MPLRLKKSLPFAEKGAEVIKSIASSGCNPSAAYGYYVMVKYPLQSIIPVLIGDSSMDMGEWIEGDDHKEIVDYIEGRIVARGQLGAVHENFGALQETLFPGGALQIYSRAVAETIYELIGKMETAAGPVKLKIK